MIFINGRNLGRYWMTEKPQNTLYLPGPWLHKGKNTIQWFEGLRSYFIWWTTKYLLWNINWNFLLSFFAITYKSKILAYCYTLGLRSRGLSVHLSLLKSLYRKIFTRKKSYNQEPCGVTKVRRLIFPSLFEEKTSIADLSWMK